MGFLFFVWVWVRPVFFPPVEEFVVGFVFGLGCFSVAVLVGWAGFWCICMLGSMYGGWVEGGMHCWWGELCCVYICCTVQV